VVWAAFVGRCSVLNKITGDKFGPLSQQMVDLLKSKATDVEILREIINIIFDKALAEPGFSTMYAELCRVLEKNCPTFETNKEGKPQVPRHPPAPLLPISHGVNARRD
jgi:translation initiation factor 4G